MVAFQLRVGGRLSDVLKGLYDREERARFGAGKGDPTEEVKGVLG